MDREKEIRQTFADRLRNLREKAGLTQTELGTLLGYSRASISYYEKAQRVPDIVFLMAVSDFFNVNPSFLIGYSQNQSLSNDDIGFRFGLSDKAIAVLDSIGLPEYGEFISAFVEHNSFPKLFDCMRCYSIEGAFSDEISLNRYLDKHEFLHFQISNIIVGILNDLRRECVPCGKEITTLDNVDMKKKIEFLSAQREQSRAASLRLIEELDARQKQHRKEINERMLKHWNESESEEP